MLKLINVIKVYDSKRALDEINLSFGNTGFYTVVGKSGSGKSTLLNILGGLVKPDGGQVLINGQDYSKLSENQKDLLRSRLFGIVFQEGNLIDNLSVKDNLKLCLNKKDYYKIDEVLKKLNLIDFGDNLANTLSGGEKQRVSIARAILKDAPIILADEPTGSLDEINGGIVMEMLKSLSEEKLVILVTHNLDYANKYADVVIELKDGKVVSQSNGDFDAIIKDFKETKSKRRSLIPVLKKHLCSSWLGNLRQISVMTVSLIAIVLILSFLFTFPIDFYSKYLILSEYKCLPLTKGYGGINVDKNELDRLHGEIAVKANQYVIIEQTKGEKNQNDKSVFAGVIQNAIIIDDNNLLDKEIIITDYVADSMAYFGFLEVINSSELIGKTIDIFDDNFIIKSILKTDYQKREKNYLNDDFYYSSIFIKRSDYDKFLNSIDVVLKISVNDQKEKFPIFINYITFLEDKTLTDNEAKISKKLYDDIESNRENYFIENVIDLKISKTYLEQEYNFTLSYKGIENYDEINDRYVIFVGSDLYKTLKNHCIPGGIVVRQFDNDDIKNLYKNGYYLYCGRFNAFANYKHIYSILLIPFIILTAGLLGVYILFLIDLTKHRIKINNRDYFILKTLGFSKSSVISIIFYQLLALIALTIIICIGTFFAVKAVLDSALKKTVIITYSLNAFYPLVTLFLLVCLIISVIIIYADKNLTKLTILNLKTGY